MKTTISDEIIKILDDLGKRFGIAIDWTSENVLPYMETLGKRIVDYEFYTSLFYVGLYAIGLIIAIIMIVYAIKNKVKIIKAIERDGFDFLLLMLSAIFIVIIIILGVFEIPEEVFDIIACKTFPEKIIFEFIKTIK